jgi:hypothetical protein
MKQMGRNLSDPMSGFQISGFEIAAVTSLLRNEILCVFLADGLFQQVTPVRLIF